MRSSVRGPWALFGAFALFGCVDEATPIDDERARLACAEAAVLDAPSAGCTTVRIASNGPYGCAVLDPSSAFLEQHAGSWVRLRPMPGRLATLRVTLVSGEPTCPADGGASACPATASLAASGGAPCTCGLGALATYPLPSAIEAPLGDVEAQVLLEPLGATFDVSLCDAASIGP